MVRIFSPREKIALFIRLLIIFVIGYYAAILLVRIFVCIPISGFWNHTGSCVNSDVMFIVDSFVSLITDGAVLVLPILLAWPLHLPLRKRLRVAGILGAGGLTTVTNVYRLILAFNEWEAIDNPGYMMRLLYTGYADIDPVAKFGRGLFINTYSAAEIGIGLTCSCLPAITALVDRKVRGRSLNSAGQRG